MASSSNPPPASSAPEPSFTMIDRDLESIGAHCHYEYCHQLDFLPFRCESCKHTYCLDHRTEDSHACPDKGAWAAKRRAASSTPSSLQPSGKPTLATGTQCSDPSCKTFVNSHQSVGVGCGTCGRTYCLKHRLPEDHKCSTLKPIRSNTTTSSTSSNPAQRAATALARLRAWGKSKADAAGKGSTSSGGGASKLVAKLTPRAAPKARTTALPLAELKKNAKGDARVPVPKRLYLHVEAVADAPAGSTDDAPSRSNSSKPPPHAPMFFSGEWSIGRMLDEAARGLHVENLNNRGGGEAERLRVFHIEAGRLLDFGEKLGECGLKNGHTVVLMRGVGPVEAAE